MKTPILTIFTALGILSSLTGCANYVEIQDNLSAMTGKDISLAQSRLGPADNITKAKDFTVYVWESGPSERYSEEFSQIGPTPGYGSDVVDETVFGSHPEQGCAIKLVTDEDNIIRSWDFQYGLGNCSKFKKKLSIPED